MGRRFVKDVLGNHLRDLSFHLVHWLSITQKLRRISQESINLERKFYLDCSSDTFSTWGELERWRIGRRPWGVGDDGRSGNLLEKTQCERDDISHTRRIYFINRRWTNRNILEKIRNWERQPWYGIDQLKERVTLTFLENQKGLFHNLTIHFRMPVKQFTIFGPCREAWYTAITLNPESNFSRREKNHSLSHWNTLT